MPSLLFNPTPEAAAQIRERFTSPVSSLSEIAAQYDTTLDALCLWISSPEVQEYLNRSESVAAQRTRHTVTHRMHYAVEALIEMLAGYTHSERKVPMTSSLAHIQCRERQRSDARRAAYLFHRLSRYHPHAFPPGFVLPLPVRFGTGRGAEALRGGEGSDLCVHAGAAPHPAAHITSDLVPTSDFPLPNSAFPLPASQLAPTSHPLDLDLHQLAVLHQPYPCDQEFEPDPFNHGEKPKPPPRLRETCKYRSDISDLKSMSGPADSS